MADELTLYNHAGQRGFAEKIRIIFAETGIVRSAAQLLATDCARLASGELTRRRNTRTCRWTARHSRR